TFVCRFEEGELHDPGEAPTVAALAGAARNQAELVGDVQAEAAEHGGDQLARAALQTTQVAVSQAGGFVDRAPEVVGHRLHRALGPGAALADARPRQAA